MGTRIQIDVNGIRLYQASIENLRNVTAHQSDASQWLNDDSTEVLNKASNSLLTSGHEVISAVSKLNSYLDKVADEFEAKDSELQSYLESGFKSESHYDNVQKRLSRLNRAVRDSKYYQVLPD